MRAISRAFIVFVGTRSNRTTNRRRPRRRQRQRRPRRCGQALPASTKNRNWNRSKNHLRRRAAYPVRTDWKCLRSWKACLTCRSRPSTSGIRDPSCPRPSWVAHQMCRFCRNNILRRHRGCADCRSNNETQRWYNSSISNEIVKAALAYPERQTQPGPRIHEVHRWRKRRATWWRAFTTGPGRTAVFWTIWSGRASRQAYQGTSERWRRWGISSSNRRRRRNIQRRWAAKRWSTSFAEIPEELRCRVWRKIAVKTRVIEDQRAG